MTLSVLGRYFILFHAISHMAHEHMYIYITISYIRITSGYVLIIIIIN